MKVLHVGCGKQKLPDYWADVEEVRLDIDPQHEPDIVASLTDLGEIGPFDIVYSSHCLEHLYPHEVGQALQEIKRVLKDGGQAVLAVPDLEDVKPTTDVLYTSDSGPICGLDLYYGHSRLIPEMPYMAHHCGFTSETLKEAMEAAGFKTEVKRAMDFNLIGVGVK